jgi:hypothetical protein
MLVPDDGDWLPDPYDNDARALGEGMTDNAAFLPAFDLARAVSRPLALIYEDDAKILSRERLLIRRPLSTAAPGGKTSCRERA